MAKPKNKEELLEAGKANYDKLMNHIEGLSDEKLKRAFPEGYLNRSISDVLAHLYEWHQMVLNWYEVGMRGEKPAIPAPGYNWKQTPELNIAIQQRYAQTSLEEASALIAESHQKVRSIIKQHSQEELFKRKRYQWTGNNAMGAYFISATASHYQWAFKLIKKCLKD